MNLRPLTAAAVAVSAVAVALIVVSVIAIMRVGGVMTGAVDVIGLSLFVLFLTAVSYGVVSKRWWIAWLAYLNALLTGLALLLIG